MTAYVFVGPTLRREEVAAACEAVCLPPVAQGDLYRVAQRNPRAIGIIDGFFSGAPSVWHKEILWALSRGIPVFGSASMGALRAAELHRFGMHGVGRIFEAFRDGVLEDDDEVAVVHGPAEIGFAPVSEPMVNIRATLAQAEIAGILSADSRRALESFGKALFFPDRSWPAILDAAERRGVGSAEVAALRAWLPEGRVDQKREDALAMLTQMRAALASPTPPSARFQFEWTHFWDELVARHTSDLAASGESSILPSAAVLEELRLEGSDSYNRANTKALLRLFAAMEAKRRGLEASPTAMRAILAEVRTGLGLLTRAELDAWMERNHMEAASLERLIEEETLSRAAAGCPGASLERYLLDELRLGGDYERLALRARRKKERLGADPLARTKGRPAAPTPIELRMWYFEHRLARPIPEDLDAFARALGFVDLADFDSALEREWLYLCT